MTGRRLWTFSPRHAIRQISLLPLRGHDIFTKCHFEQSAFCVVFFQFCTPPFVRFGGCWGEFALDLWTGNPAIKCAQSLKPKEGLAFTYQPWENFAILNVHYMQNRSYTLLGATPVSVSSIPACLRIFPTFTLEGPEMKAKSWERRLNVRAIILNELEIGTL